MTQGNDDWASILLLLEQLSPLDFPLSQWILLKLSKSSHGNGTPLFVSMWPHHRFPLGNLIEGVCILIHTHPGTLMCVRETWTALISLFPRRHEPNNKKPFCARGAWEMEAPKEFRIISLSGSAAVFGPLSLIAHSHTHKVQFKSRFLLKAPSLTSLAHFLFLSPASGFSAPLLIFTLHPQKKLQRVKSCKRVDDIRPFYCRQAAIQGVRERRNFRERVCE